MQPREPSLSSQTSYNEQLISLEHVNDSAVFYSGKQHGKHLDLLLHLSRYSNLLLTVTGQQGSGKTHLKNRMLQQLDSGVVVSLVDAKQASTAAQLLPLLSQNLNIEIPAKADFSFYLTEIRNFSSQLNDEGGSCLIVIDNAENLEQDAIHLILDLATTASDSHRPHLALFGRPELFTKLHKKENITRFESVGHHLPLEAFSETEAKAYLEHRCASVGINQLPLTEKQFANAFQTSKGLPGLLNVALVEQLRQDSSQLITTPTKPTPKKSKEKAKPAPKAKNPKAATGRKFPIVPLIAVTTIVALLVVGFIYKDQLKPSATPDTSLISRSQEIRQGKEIPWQPPPPSVLENALPEIKTEPEIVHLPEPFIEPEVEVQVEEVVKPAPQVEAAKQQPILVAKPKVETPLDLPDDTPAAIQPSVKPPPKAVVETPKKLPAKASPWVDKGSRREATLMAKPADHFTLQMMGSLDEASVKSFIQAQTTQAASYSYFESRYKGQPWYVVVYGDFSNRDNALAAIQNLPEALQKQRPWARNFQSVQTDLRSR